MHVIDLDAALKVQSRQFSWDHHAGRDGNDLVGGSERQEVWLSVRGQKGVMLKNLKDDQVLECLSLGRHDIEHNDTQYNGIQHNETQHDSKLNTTLSI